MKIKKGDKVKIIAGVDKGKEGKVLSTNPSSGRVLVEGIQLVKKHQRPKKQGKKGEIITIPRPIHASNVLLICLTCGKASRLGKRLESDKMVRYCKKCKATIG